MALWITTTRKLWNINTETEKKVIRINENHFQVFRFGEFLNTEYSVACCAENAAKILNSCMGSQSESYPNPWWTAKKAWELLPVMDAKLRNR